MSQAKKKAESCHVVTKRNLQMASGLVTKPPKAKPSGLGRMKEHVETQRELAVHFERWGRGGVLCKLRPQSLSLKNLCSTQGKSLGL